MTLWCRRGQFQIISIATLKTIYSADFSKFPARDPIDLGHWSSRLPLTGIEAGMFPIPASPPDLRVVLLHGLLPPKAVLPSLPAVGGRAANQRRLFWARRTETGCFIPCNMRSRARPNNSRSHIRDRTSSGSDVAGRCTDTRAADCVVVVATAVLACHPDWLGPTVRVEDQRLAS